MSDAATPPRRRWIFVTVIVLYLAIAVWRAVQGRFLEAGFDALVAIGFAIIVTTPDYRGLRAWIGTGLFLIGALGPIALNL